MTSNWSEASQRRRPDGKFDGYDGQPQAGDGTLEDGDSGSSPLWKREGVDAAKATALTFDDGAAVMVAKGTGPADGLQAAREILGDDAGFSHLHNGYPVYRADGTPEGTRFALPQDTAIPDDKALEHYAEASLTHDPETASAALHAGPSMTRDEIRDVIGARREQLTAMGFVPAQHLNAALGDPRYAGDDQQRETWWGAEKALAEYGRPGGDYRQMPDNYTPSRTLGRGTFGLRRTYRMHYEGAGVSLRMPSATSIRRFEAEKPGKSIVVPVTAQTPHGDVTGWVRLTKGAGNTWEARAGGFGDDAAGVERAADMAEAVQCVMESRRVTTALRNAGSLPERRRQRLAAEGEKTVMHPVTSSSFIKGIGYNQAAGAVAVDIRGTTYGYSASPQQMEQFIGNAEQHGWGHAYNEMVKKRLPRAEISACPKCGASSAPHLAHRCRVAPVAGGATGGWLGYEGTARRSAAVFAAAARPAGGGR